MKYLLFLCALLTSVAHAQFKWDLPYSELGKLVGQVHLIDLEQNDTAFIEASSVFCLDPNGHLAVDGFTQTGSGDLKIKMLADKKVSIETNDVADLLDELVFNESFAACDWWTSLKGESVFIVDNINGKKSLSALGR